MTTGASPPPVMPITWSTFTLPDGRTHPQIEICDAADWDVFDRTAALLQSRLVGRWVAQLDGLDQRDWDLEADGGRITLHLEHYLGISVYAVGGAEPDAASVALLKRAHGVLGG